MFRTSRTWLFLPILIAAAVAAHEAGPMPAEVPETDATGPTDGALPAGNAGRTDPVGLILEALPRAILAQFQEDRAAKLRATERQDDDRARAAAVADVLATIPNALVASYRADRERVRLAA